MERRSTERTCAPVRLLALAALGLAAWPAAGRAVPQDRTQVECRCVDRDGDVIENCSCLVLSLAARPRIGISVSTEQGSDVDARGARVTSVLPGGPAYEAGIREGDIITRIDGRSLLEPLEAEIERDLEVDESLPAQRLLVLARRLEPGQEVEIEYLRGAERRTVAVRAEDLAGRVPGGPWFDADRLREQLRGAGERLRVLDLPPGASNVEVRVGGAGTLALGLLGASRYGLELVELNPSLGAYFGAERGVLVTNVGEGSTLGLRPGDVILRVGDREVGTPERVIRILSSYADDEQVTFRVRRSGSEIDVLGRVTR